MPIVEFKKGEAEKFVTEMKAMLDKEKSGPERFRLFIASGNRRIILQPQVTTQRVNNLLIRDFEPSDVKKIKEAAASKGIEITEHWNFFFDERKEPSAKVPTEEGKEARS